MCRACEIDFGPIHAESITFQGSLVRKTRSRPALTFSMGHDFGSRRDSREVTAGVESSSAIRRRGASYTGLQRPDSRWSLSAISWSFRNSTVVKPRSATQPRRKTLCERERRSTEASPLARHGWSRSRSRVFSQARASTWGDRAQAPLIENPGGPGSRGKPARTLTRRQRRADHRSAVSPVKRG